MYVRVMSVLLPLTSIVFVSSYVLSFWPATGVGALVVGLSCIYSGQILATICPGVAGIPQPIRDWLVKPLPVPFLNSLSAE